MRLLLSLGLILFISAPISASADSRTLLQDFAGCAGRYSAQMEWHWLMDQSGAENSEQKRAAFVSLIDAILPDASNDGVAPRDVLAWRIDAKFAHSTLLQTATFNTDAAIAAPAEQAAKLYIDACAGLLLAG